MKKYRIIYKILLLLALAGCTNNFEELNQNPNSPNPANIPSIGPLLTNAQRESFCEDWFNLWRGNLIFGERFAEQFSFGFSSTWFGDGSGFNFNAAWTDAAWTVPYSRVTAPVNQMLELTAPGARLEDLGANAVVRIVKALTYQRITDQFGDVPYFEAGTGNPTPKFDKQQDIYNDIMSLLKQAITDLSGLTDVTTISAISNGDIVFKGNKLQWIKVANTLRLRMAMRSRLAATDGNATIISECMTDGRFLSSNDDVFRIFRDPGNKGLEGLQGYYDIWWTFDGCCGAAAKWVVAETMVNYLKSTGDPRLFQYAMPVGTHPAGDTASYVGGKVAAKASYTSGVPFDSLSKPRMEIWNDPAFPFITMTWSEAELLQAQAHLLAGENADAQTHFQAGIRASMEYWGVPESDITTFLASPVATLSATQATALEQIGDQRWLAVYTNGYEAWSVMREYHLSIYPDKTYSDAGIWALTSSGVDNKMPRRLQYGPSATSLNGKNAALGTTPDKMSTPVWWDVK